MRHTLYKRLVYWIDANQTWIEVVNDNLYKEQLIKGRGRTGYWVSRNLMLKAYRSNGAYKKGTIWIIPENDWIRHWLLIVKKILYSSSALKLVPIV